MSKCDCGQMWPYPQFQGHADWCTVIAGVPDDSQEVDLEELLEKDDYDDIQKAIDDFLSSGGADISRTFSQDYNYADWPDTGDPPQDDTEKLPVEEEPGPLD